MLKVVAILVVLCGISAAYSVPQYNAFMYYQQPMYGFQYQNQQLRNQQRLAGVGLRNAKNTELPVQDDQAVESSVEDLPVEQTPVEDEPQYDAPAVNDQEAEDPIADEPIPAASDVPAVVTEKKKTKKTTVRQDSAEDDAQAPAPNAYFPINFGSTNGGAIAIANSYSTGKGGSAVSTATAYGSPSVDELRRVAPAAAGQLRRRPAKQY